MSTIRPNIAQYPNGFTDGVTVRNVPILNTYSGQLWWVDSTGAQIGDGKFNRPFATIDAAINHAAAGDTILVKEGHAETVTAAAGIDADVAGIKVIGLGQGRRRPTISFTTSDLADIDIDAANITFSNLVFDFTGVASLAAPIDVNAADFTLQGCELIQTSATNQGLKSIVTATGASRMRVIGNKILAPTAGATAAIDLVGTPDGIEIRDNVIIGDFSTAAIMNATGAGNTLTNLLIDGNYVRNDNAADWAIELVADCTGVIQHNTFATDAIATAVDWGNCAAFDNLYFDTSDTDANATPIPTAQTTGGMDLQTIADRIGSDADTDAIAAMLGGTAGIATMPAAAVPANAINMFELLRQIWANQAGTAANENGITTFPAAELPGNNVSIAEVLRETYDQSEKCVTNTTAILENGTTLFTIAGGPIEILSLVARCVVGGDAAASTIQWSADPTDGDAATFSGASASVAASAAGAMVVLQGTALDTAPTLATTGVSLSMSGATPTTGIIVGAGIITSIIGTADTTTGTWQHHLRYRPLSRGVTVIGA